MYVSPDIKEYKKRKRAEYRRIRGNIAPGERAEMDRKILENLLFADEYRSCKTVLTYISSGTEADTRELVVTAVNDGKTVAAPRCINGTNDMVFYVIESFEQLEEGAYSLLEPSNEKCRRLKSFDSAICIIPALAYDEQGFRIGYGKGYYDKFLSSHKELYKIGIEYSICTEISFEKDDFDIPVDMLITEKYIKRIKEQEAG